MFQQKTRSVHDRDSWKKWPTVHGRKQWHDRTIIYWPPINWNEETQTLFNNCYYPWWCTLSLDQHDEVLFEHKLRTAGSVTMDHFTGLRAVQIWPRWTFTSGVISRQWFKSKLLPICKISRRQYDKPLGKFHPTILTLHFGLLKRDSILVSVLTKAIVNNCCNSKDRNVSKENYVR